MLVPPALLSQVHPSALPLQVHRTLKEAQAQAKELRHGVLSFVLRNPGDEALVLDFLSTIPGIRMRSRWEVWLAAPGDPELDHRIKAAKEIETPNLLIFGDPNAPPQLFKDELKGFLTMLASESAEGRPSLDLIKSSCPQLKDPGRMLEFGEARAKDQKSAAAEPYRSWLVDALKVPALRAWAAARLVEAGAVNNPGEEDAFAIYSADASRRMFTSIGGGVAESLGAPWGWSALGDIDDIDDDAPLFLRLRRELVSGGSHIFSLKYYAVLAPHLHMEDRGWVRGILVDARSEAMSKTQTVQDTVAFWIASDWLLLYGMPEDWVDFRNASPDPMFGSRVYQLQLTLQGIKHFWGSAPSNFIPMGDGKLLWDLWNKPDARIAAWGIPDAAFRSKGVQRAFMAHEPLFVTGYTNDGLDHKYEGRIVVRVKVDGQGGPAAIRPKPGYGLFRFAEDIMKEAERCRYHVGSVGGFNIPDICEFGINYKIDKSRPRRKLPY